MMSSKLDHVYLLQIKIFNNRNEKKIVWFDLLRHYEIHKCQYQSVFMLQIKIDTNWNYNKDLFILMFQLYFMFISYVMAKLLYYSIIEKIEEKKLIVLIENYNEILKKILASLKKGFLKMSIIHSFIH